MLYMDLVCNQASCAVSNHLYLLSQLCEIDLGHLLPAESLSPFMDEIKNREKQRKRLARKVLFPCSMRG